MVLATNHIFCIGWAAFCGISVPLGQIATANLNELRTDQQGTFQAVYITQGCVFTGGLLLLAVAQFDGGSFCWPTKTWALFGGIASLSAFACVVAVPVLGSAMILMIQLCGLLVTSLAFDIYDRRVGAQDWRKYCCLACVLAGAGLRAWDLQLGPIVASPRVYAYALGVFASGVGYAIEAKCNMALREDFRSPARAAAVSAAAHCFGAMFINLYLYFEYGFTPIFRLDKWPLWLAGGSQSAFVIGSMSFLPQVLGYTTSYVGSQVGKFLTASAADALGSFGFPVPITVAQLLSVVLVCVGAVGDAIIGRDALPPKADDYPSADERLPVQGQHYGSFPGEELFARDDSN